MQHVAIQHWIVPAVRHVGLPGADRLSITADTSIQDAWDLVQMTTGRSAPQIANVIAQHLDIQRAGMGSGVTGLASMLPAAVARKLGMIVLSCDDTQVTVATADPVGLDAEHEVSRLLDRSVHVELATPDEISAALDAAYPGRTAEPVHDVGVVPGEDLAPQILVVEDDPVTQHMIGKLLRGEGFRVQSTADPDEALELLDDPGGFHLVTLDLNLGKEKTGLDLLIQIRSRVRTADLPVVVATGIDEPDVERELFKAGADDFVLKPLDPPRFLLRLQAVLRRYRASWFETTAAH